MTSPFPACLYLVFTHNDSLHDHPREAVALGNLVASALHISGARVEFVRKQVWCGADTAGFWSEESHGCRRLEVLALLDGLRKRAIGPTVRGLDAFPLRGSVSRRPTLRFRHVRRGGNVLSDFTYTARGANVTNLNRALTKVCIHFGGRWGESFYNSCT